MEIFGFAITIMSFVLAWQTYKNGKWMKETAKGQNSLLGKQTEMIGKQTEMIGELKNTIIEEAKLTRESTQAILLKISEMIAGVPKKTAALISEENTEYKTK